jgi:hypothetical protein
LATYSQKAQLMKRNVFVQAVTLDAIHALAREDAHELRHTSLLKPGNAKTGTQGKYGSVRITKGLPIHDCPDATPACSKACYALKFATWGTLKQGNAGHYSRLAHENPEELHRLLRRDVLATLIYEPEGFIVRIHEAGDFVNAAHAEVYLRLAVEFPTVTFFGYSRGWVNRAIAPVLVAMNGLLNANLRESLDRDRPVGTGNAPVAFYGPRELEPADAFKCPEQLGGPKCGDCGLCWRSPRPVVFKQH